MELNQESSVGHLTSQLFLERIVEDTGGEHVGFDFSYWFQYLEFIQLNQFHLIIS
jgi:hypothetical protein